MENVFDVLKERGFINQTSDDERIREKMGREQITCYIGFDPTADSLHVGSLVPIMALAHLQRHGHNVICVLGAGTAMVGDPSGKTEMRKMLTREQIDKNGECFKKQFSRYISFNGERGMMVNNADWLLPLNYIEFLRDIGPHFSVNRMLTFESVKLRLEKGLSFLEFNYMLLQAYDFYHLFKNNNCTFQMGGDDQWGNIIAGIELIRRKLQGNAYCVTFPLLTTSSGYKFGKTEKGAVWLDAHKTSPYDFYQYWVNADDKDVVRYLKLFTFLPIEEINRLGALKGAEINKAKRVLAYEITKINHGEEEAEKAREAARGIFGGGDLAVSDDAKMPTMEISSGDIERGIPAAELFQKTGLTSSKAEAKRLIKQGGAYLNQRRIMNIDEIITEAEIVEGTFFLRKGKKRYFRIIVR